MLGHRQKCQVARMRSTLHGVELYGLRERLEGLRIVAQTIMGDAEGIEDKAMAKGCLHRGRRLQQSQGIGVLFASGPSHDLPGSFIQLKRILAMSLRFLERKAT